MSENENKEENKPSDDQSATKSPASEALALLANPQMKALLDGGEQLQKLVKTTSSSHIVDKGAGRGFSDFAVMSDLEEVKGMPRDMLQKWLEDDGEALVQMLRKNGKTVDLADGCQKLLSRALDVLAADGELYRKQYFSIGFQTGNGTCVTLFVYFEKRDDGKFDFKKLAMSGKFALAPDWVVVRKTKDGFFSSSSKDEIHYVPRGITGEDVAALMDIVVPRVVDQMIKLIPDSEKKAITQK
jgi:hypothetical protein